MKSTFETLVNVLEYFQEDWIFDLDLEGCKAYLSRQIESECVDGTVLRKEYKEAIQREDTDWKAIAIRSQLLDAPNNYSNEQIKSISEIYLNDILFPEWNLSEADKQAISAEIRDIFCAKKHNEWISVEHLLELLQIKFPQVHLYHLYLSGDFFEVQLEGKRDDISKIWVLDHLRLSEPCE